MFKIVKLILFLLSSFLFVFLYLYLFNSQYKSDRFIFLYKDEENNSKVIMLELTKYYNLLPFNYDYVYSSILTGENTKTYTKRYRFNSFTNDFIPRGFVKIISNQNNENILNENYKLNFYLDDLNIGINLLDMKGDFLINNSLHRFTYVNLGTTNITINNKVYKSDFIFNKTRVTNPLINNFTHELESKGIVSYFTDFLGNIYSTDITNVYKTNTNYISHAWMVNKNNEILKKEAGKNVELISNDDKNIIFKFSGINKSNIILNKGINLSDGKEIYNFSKGTITDNSGTREIFGFSNMYDDK